VNSDEVTHVQYRVGTLDYEHFNSVPRDPKIAQANDQETLTIGP
jgi:hypothetical protein